MPTDETPTTGDKMKKFLYDDLKPRQRTFVTRFYHTLIDKEKIDSNDASITGGSIKRSYLDYIAIHYFDMSSAPAWIVHDKERRDPDKWGHYFVPELSEYGIAYESSTKEAGEPIPIPDDLQAFKELESAAG